MITVLYFGPIYSITTVPKEKINNVSDLTSLHKLLLKKYPKLLDTHFVFSVNQKITDNCTLHEDDEVALLPPFSGG